MDSYITWPYQIADHYLKGSHGSGCIINNTLHLIYILIIRVWKSINLLLSITVKPQCLDIQ